MVRSTQSKVLQENSWWFPARLWQNRGVSYFEECLTLGQWLGQENRRALYKYLLVINDDLYQSQANLLLSVGILNKTIANGEIIFSIKDGCAHYIARKLDSDEFTPVIRAIKLSRLRFYKVRRLRKFFAQGDVDVIHNFPLPGANPQSEGGFSINTYPYYKLAYYSDGKNRLLGLINKIRTDDRQLLTKLRSL